MRFCTVVVTAALFFPIVCPLAAQQPPPLESGEGVRVSRACRERVLSTGQRRTDCRRDAGTLTSLSSGAVVFRIDEGTGFAQRTTLEGMIRDTVLSNGLAVIAVRNPVIPAVTVEIAFRNGAFTQLELEEEGLPHLIEHILFKAYGRGDWSSRVAGLDGMSNATTGVETVTYYIIAPPENLEKAVELLSRLVRRPTFERNDLENEKRVVKNELERDAADPFHLLNFHTDRVLFGPAFRQKNPRGNLFSIQGTTTRMLQDHHERYYVPNNAALVVTGDISPEEVFEVAREHLDGWDREADPFEGFTHPPVRPLTRDSIFVIRTDAPNVTLSVAWQGPSVNEDPEGAVAADLFSEIVTQRVSGAYSRLVDSGLYHFLSFSYSPSNHVGPIKLVARTVPEKVADPFHSEFPPPSLVYLVDEVTEPNVCVRPELVCPVV